MAWPFTNAELTAGLRRYFAQPGLRVRGASDYPPAAPRLQGRAAQGVRGLRVDYVVGEAASTVDCVVKEPVGRTGLASPGLCEAGLYRSLAMQLPMPTPALIAADPDGAWLVLEAVEAVEAPGAWGAEEFYAAVKLLARLHERFWGLADDLDTYLWLLRPLTRDYGIHVQAAAHALGQMVRDEWPPLIAHSPQIVGALGQIISQAEQVVAPLRAQPFTLLHGDYWAGSIVRDETGDMIVLDWGLAGLGPGVLDLVTTVTTSQWLAGELPVPAERLAARYRREVAALVGRRWSEAEWSEQWDHALLWRFMQEMLTWVASAPREIYQARAQQFEDVWLRPALAAAGRRLPPLSGL
ncbi:MAG: aminoglycoside phosphotransferase family protein [Anaerolineales bacterium]|nr:aminoglycoside phosphotransferase family protein [Anaerolineales bacterium]